MIEFKNVSILDRGDFLRISAKNVERRKIREAPHD